MFYNRITILITKNKTIPQSFLFAIQENENISKSILIMNEI